MGRKRFSEREVLETLIHQGIEIKCYRTGELITLQNVRLVEKEHLVELGLFETDAEKAKHDVPENCRFSLKEAHAVITNGKKATTAGSSKHRIKKAKRIARGGKKVRHPMRSGSRTWPKGRKLQSKPFQKRK